LPIGASATENAVIPYVVSVDIGCRMCLSVFDIDPKELVQKEPYFTRELNEATLFGSGRDFEHPTPHEVIDRKEFGEIGLLKKLQGRAAKQLGSSGSGNHFVEFGIVEIMEKDEILNWRRKLSGIAFSFRLRGLGQILPTTIPGLPGEKSCPVMR
jgi:tRNA-splicing ligase RtcB